MNLRVSDVQPSLFPLPSRFPAYRRVSCRCGCGLWFYAIRAKGRPPSFIDLEHYRKSRNERRRQDAALGTEPVHARRVPQPPDRENVR